MTKMIKNNHSCSGLTLVDKEYDSDSAYYENYKVKFARSASSLSPFITNLNEVFISCGGGLETSSECNGFKIVSSNDRFEVYTFPFVSFMIANNRVKEFESNYLPRIKLSNAL